MANQNDWLVIANGEPLPNPVIESLIQNKSIMMLDGAYQSAANQLFTPDIVLGDFDSLAMTAEANDSARFVHTPDQNATDLEKGLCYLAKQKVNSVTIINATGWRLDHTLYNLRLLKRFHGLFSSLVIYTATEKIIYLENTTVVLQAKPPQPLALMAFPAARVSTQGLQYDMQNYQLQFAERESVSNQVVKQQAEIAVQGYGLLLTDHTVSISKLS